MIVDRPGRRVYYRRANALARLAKADYPDAMEALAHEMYGLVEAIIHKRNWFLAGAEFEDLVQEGIKRLPATLADWDENVAQWTSFAQLAIARDLQEAITRERRRKHQMHLNAVSLNVTVGRGDGRDDDDRQSLWVLPDFSGLGDNPADVLCTGDGDGNWVLAILRDGASELEETVMRRCILRREDYKTVAASLGRGRKSIDNAIQRVRRRAMRRLVGLAERGELDEDTAARIRRLALRRNWKG